MKLEFSSSEMTRYTDTKLNRVQQWMDRGWIGPSIQQGQGPGSRNLWSAADLIRIIVFRKAVDSGIARKVVADLLTIFPMPNNQILADSGLDEEDIEFLNADMDKILTGQYEFPSPMYFAFLRKDGDFIKPLILAYGKEAIWIKILDERDADDFIGINFSKILSELQGKLREGGKI